MKKQQSVVSLDRYDDLVSKAIERREQYADVKYRDGAKDYILSELYRRSGLMSDREFIDVVCAAMEKCEIYGIEMPWGKMIRP